MTVINRRNFLQSTTLGVAGLATASATGAQEAPQTATVNPNGGKPRLGLVTYNMGKDMPLRKLIRFCEECGLEAVELRSTHAHGVEPTLSKDERAEVKKRFADTPVRLIGLGTANEFHARDAAELRRHIDEAKAFATLAADVGAQGIKLRPNRLHDDEDHDITLRRIGDAWREVAEFAAALGVETRMEVHGTGTKEPANMRKIWEHAAHPNARINWNSNDGEQDENGSIKGNFDLLREAFGTVVHITDIGIQSYPWQELFDLLRATGYEGYCLAEIQFNPEPERFMKYYKTVFDGYLRA